MGLTCYLTLKDDDEHDDERFLHGNQIYSGESTGCRIPVTGFVQATATLRRFIPQCAQLMQPLADLLKGKTKRLF